MRQYFRGEVDTAYYETIHLERCCQSLPRFMARPSVPSALVLWKAEASPPVMDIRVVTRAAHGPPTHHPRIQNPDLHITPSSITTITTPNPHHTLIYSPP